MNIRLLTPLTPETFAPFGQVLTQPERAPDSHNQALSYWHDLTSGFDLGRITLSYFQLKPRPRVLTQMECHPDHEEVFIPLKGTGIMVFAPNQKEGIAPDIDKAVAFIMDGRTPFLIRRKVWHDAAFPEGDTLDFLLALPDIALEPRFCEFRPVNITVLNK